MEVKRVEEGKERGRYDKKNMGWKERNKCKRVEGWGNGKYNF